MQALSYTALRNNLAKSIDQVCEDHAPILVTRQNGNDAVLISREDFDAYEETAYLLRNPKNAERLLKAIQDVENGKNLKQRKLTDD